MTRAGRGHRDAALRWLGAAVFCLALGTVVILTLGVRGPGRSANDFAHLPFVDMWLRWDAGWYFRIATHGYDFSTVKHSSVAFFPLYPLAIAALGLLGIPAFIAGIVLTAVFGFVAFQLFAKWVAAVAPGHEAAALTFVAVWPFAYYLYGAVYSDALFLALAIGAFLLLERGNVWGAAVLGALATATRPIAPAVVIGLLVRQLELRRRAGQPIRAVDFVPLGAGAGLAAYMAYLWARFGDPLAFINAQAAWSQLTGVSAVFKQHLWQQGASWPWWDWLLPLVHVLAAFGFLALAWPLRRLLGWGYAVYVALALGIPTLASRDFIGLGRYALAAFPCFVMLAHLTKDRPRVRIAAWACSVALLGLCTAKYAMGRYIS